MKDVRLSASSEILYMNYMKFFGIIYLLIWHANIKKINIIVILFFLQMFIFISGYFYKDIYTLKPFRFAYKRIKSLYVPFVIYCSLFLLLNNVFVFLKVYGENKYIPYERFPGLLAKVLLLKPGGLLSGAMWFVAALFITSILFCLISSILNKICASKKTLSSIPFFKEEYLRFITVVSLFMLGNYLSIQKIIMPLYLDISLVFLLFYYLGYLYRKGEKFIPVNIYIATVAVITLIVCSKYGYPQIFKRRYISPTFILVCGIAGIYLNVYVAKQFARIKNFDFIHFVGRNTLAILALHFLAFKTVSLYVIYTQNLSLDLLSSFPVIKSTSQFCRWGYAMSGLFLPLAWVYVFSFGYGKVRNRFVNPS